MRELLRTVNCPLSDWLLKFHYHHLRPVPGSTNLLMLLAAKVIAISGHAGAYALMSLADATTRTRASFHPPRQLHTELLPQTGAIYGP